MSSIHRAHEIANLTLPELLTHEQYELIRNFYHTSSGDANPRTLFHMLTDRLTFGFVIGLYHSNPLYQKLLSALSAGQQEMRNRVYDDKIKSARALPADLSNIKISL